MKKSDLKAVWNHLTNFRNRRIKDKKDYELQSDLPWNIYRVKKDDKIGKHLKKFHVIHQVIKYKIFVPFFLIFDRFFDKYLEKEVPKLPYNNNMLIFNRAYDRAVSKWLEYFFTSVFRCNQSNHNTDYRKRPSVRIVYSIKKLLLTIALNDTAYRALMDIFVFEILKEGFESYKDDKEVKHLFYTRKSIFDVDYYKTWTDGSLQKVKGFDYGN